MTIIRKVYHPNGPQLDYIILYLTSGEERQFYRSKTFKGIFEIVLKNLILNIWPLLPVVLQPVNGNKGEGKEPQFRDYMYHEPQCMLPWRRHRGDVTVASHLKPKFSSSLTKKCTATVCSSLIGDVSQQRSHLGHFLVVAPPTLPLLPLMSQ